MSNGNSLRHLNTFGIEAACAQLILINSESELLSYLSRPHSRFKVLGGGSNILFTRDFDGDILLNQMKGKWVVFDQGDEIHLRVASGENWHELVEWTVNQGYGGIENLALIPGTAGAAPIQNIGAYGVELKDVLLEVEFIDLNTGENRKLSGTDCRFGYRDSIFKNELRDQFFITFLVLQLKRNSTLNTKYDALEQYLQDAAVVSPTLRDVFDAVVAVRRSKLPDPAELGNAGSFFKNPVVSPEQLKELMENFPDIRHYPFGQNQYKLAAAWLIEQSGLKGLRHGQVGTHEKQPLVLVNHGGASGTDIWSFALFVIETVRSRFGVTLEPEVNIL